MIYRVQHLIKTKGFGILGIVQSNLGCNKIRMGSIIKFKIKER